MKTLPLCAVVSTLLATAAAAIVGGCTSYHLHVDAISRTPAVSSAQMSYTIKNKNPAIDSDSLRYREAAARLTTALSSRGLWETPDPAEADMVVELDYAMEPAHVIYRTSEVPVYVPTASPSSSVNARQIFGTTTEQVPVVVSEKHLSVSCRENKPGAEGRPPLELWQVSASLEDSGTSLRESLPVLAAAVMNQLGRTTSGMIDHQLAADDPAVEFIAKGF
jgi:hypothetical protein